MTEPESGDGTCRLRFLKNTMTMKRTFIIALCCLTALLAACNKEDPKPYERFVGIYEGSGLVNGTMTTVFLNQEFNQDFNDIELQMKINLAPGDADDKVVLTYLNDELEETYTATGTITGDNVDFDPVTINTTVENYVVSATLDMTGALNGTGLTLNGTVTGEGTISEGELNLPYTIAGTMVGTLTKSVVAE